MTFPPSFPPLLDAKFLVSIISSTHCLTSPLPLLPASSSSFLASDFLPTGGGGGDFLVSCMAKILLLGCSQAGNHTQGFLKKGHFLLSPFYSCHYRRLLFAVLISHILLGRRTTTAFPQSFYLSLPHYISSDRRPNTRSPRRRRRKYPSPPFPSALLLLFPLPGFGFQNSPPLHKCVPCGVTTPPSPLLT